MDQHDDDDLDDVVEQAKQCLCNIGAALAKAGSGCGDVVRVRHILPDRTVWGSRTRITTSAEPLVR